MLRRVAPAVLVLILLSRCALYSDVAVQPLRVMPGNIDRGTDLQQMLRKADYLRAIELTATTESGSKRSAVDLAALGSAYLTAGRFDLARQRLRNALDLDPFRTVYAEVAWNLSQVEYMSNNFDASLEWALIAREHGLQLKQWHVDYLRALSNVPVYRFSGSASERLPFKFGRPDVPRITARINGTREVEGIIDSGAVLSIISDRLAKSLGVKSLGAFEGTFYGLLGEPIPVRFGLLDRVDLGKMVIENVPVAIMPDDKMLFLVSKRDGRQFKMDFLLGSNLLKEFRLELDFSRHHVGFTHLTDRDRIPDADQNLFYEGFRPHVRGVLNGKGWFLFVLDTGSEITFLNEARLALLPIHAFGQSSHSATLQGLGGSMKHGSKLDHVEIGIDTWAGVFKTIPMYSTGGKEQSVGIIGQNFLKNFNVVVDFGRMRVDLKRR
jgi:tetratricopeptide (TPR) repeat protein